MLLDCSVMCHCVIVSSGEKDWLIFCYIIMFKLTDTRLRCFVILIIKTATIIIHTQVKKKYEPYFEQQGREMCFWDMHFYEIRKLLVLLVPVTAVTAVIFFFY